MRHHYAGDEGDFTKYALLRAIQHATSDRMGVNWYLTAHDEATRDGELRRHLDAPDAWRSLDAGLVDRFVDVFGALPAGDRHVQLLEDAAMVGADTVFYGAPLPTGEVLLARRQQARAQWHAAALEALAPAGTVFLDPDNGFQVPSVGPRAARRCKYATYAEVGDYLRRGQAVVSYQHARRMAWPALVEQVTRELRSAEVPTVRPGFIAFGTRGYFLLARDPRLERRMLDAARALQASGFRALNTTLLPTTAGQPAAAYRRPVVARMVPMPR